MKQGFREPPAELFATVMRRIKQERELKRARIRSWIFGTAAFVSFAGIIPVFSALSSQLGQSGILQMISTDFFDVRVITAVWSDALFFFFESLPIIPLALFFCIAFVFLGSLKLLAKNLSSLEAV